ncbi:threonine synthase [bacterium]|nr:threonine synthase [bacterium]
MKFYSTKDRSVSVSLKEAVINNLPAGGGLYLPEEIPRIQPGQLESLASLSFPEHSFEILHTLLTNSLPRKILEAICYKAFSFDVPLVRLATNLYTLELFHGPSLAFKDFGVRFMAELLTYYHDGRDLTVLTATSGDTGGAVAAAFYARKGFDVFILYPSGKVSALQELQIASLGGNVRAIEVDGTFDDCQRLVKSALVDQKILARRTFCSANSINVARLLPQICYYFWAVTKLPAKTSPIFSVPSGNFGNVTACLLAKQMGLPVKTVVAATNVNDIVPRYLRSGNYEVQQFKSTLANAMDIADPSNFIRIQALYQDSLEKLQSELQAFAFSDEETKAAIAFLYRQYRYSSEPHAAIGYLGLKLLLQQDPNSIGVFLGTAHPLKFKDIVEPILATQLAEPAEVSKFKDAKKRSIKISAQPADLATILTA